MADYSQLKVPDLKKLLQERGLVISGNKADLIARLQESDKKSGTGAGECSLKLAPDSAVADANMSFSRRR
jgi:hypothetical protein